MTSRRHFLATVACGGLWTGLTGLTRPPGVDFRATEPRATALPPTGPRDGAPRLDPRLDPRLEARPVRPFREAEPGVTEFGQNLERGGLLYVPGSYSQEAPAPLIVALHGSGGRSDSWSRLFDLCEEFGVILLAPDSRGTTWDRVNADFGPDVRFIDAALRFTFERCAVDPTRLALAGFSDGASYALSLGPSNGDLFTHLIAWSPGFSSPVEPIVGSPSVFVSHGTADRVLPVSASSSGIVPMFEMDGYVVAYEEFDGAHEIPDPIARRAMEWFLA